MKKTLSLKDAMRSLHVIETDEGIELQSAAGTAKYDAWGARREVNGIPEYFPSSVTVNKRPQALVDDKGPSVPDDSCAPLVRTMKLRVELDTSGAQQAVDELDDKIRNSDAFKVLKDGWTFEKNGVLIINNGEVFVTDAKIDDAVLSNGNSVKLNVAGKGKPHEAGMTLGVEGEHSKVEFLADRYKVHEAAQSASNNEKTTFNVGLSFGGFPGAISHDKANPADGDKATAEPISSIASATGIATKTRLTDEMQELVVKAVRESDLFAALQAKIDAQTASVVGLQQAMHEAVNDALRNALKPGGILWNTRSSGL
ncbi:MULTISPECIES: phage tail tip fiber protein [unclassified Enterobacter cloacae complex]|uniref:phage tail tip fiber protein n=1 Tax=unclassified Enterobacter cloacae complex TaxID=2757714 RepID=UPI003AAD6455